MNQVAIESAFTAIATRVRSERPPAHIGERFRLQQRRLRGEPQQRHSRRCCHTRLLATDQDLTDVLLECLDPLAHRRRRDVQPVCRGVEAAVFDHRGERGELLSVEMHIRNANAYEETLAVLIRPDCLPSMT